MKKSVKLSLGLIVLVPLALYFSFHVFLAYQGLGFFLNIEKDLIHGKDPDRYKYWCRYAAAWSDHEQKEFKLLNDKFGSEPGNPCTHCFNNNEIGIWVEKKIAGQPGYMLQISLLKNTVSKKLRMEATLTWEHPELSLPGNPQIIMNIPMSEFENILNNWLSLTNINLLIEEAKKVNWKPISIGEPYDELPAVIVPYTYN